MFTVPIVAGRPTRVRARLVDGRVEHLYPPSYDGVPGTVRDDFTVFYEFGDDFLERCRAVGFVVEAVRVPENPALVTLIARKP